MFSIQNFKNNDYETAKSCGQVGVRTHSHHWDGANHVAGVDFQVTWSYYVKWLQNLIRAFSIINEAFGREAILQITVFYH